MKTVTPTIENVSWDHHGMITVDGLAVAKVDGDGDCYWQPDVVDGIDAECDIDELKSAVSALIAETNPEDHYINENVAAWAAS